MTAWGFQDRLAALGIHAPVVPHPVGVVFAAPPLVEELLARTPPERLALAQPRIVDCYAQQMTTGRWAFTGDPIKFNYRGDQIDGTHRLLAMRYASWSGPLALALDLDPGAAWVMTPPGR